MSLAQGVLLAETAAAAEAADRAARVFWIAPMRNPSALRRAGASCCGALPRGTMEVAAETAAATGITALVAEAGSATHAVSFARTHCARAARLARERGRAAWLARRRSLAPPSSHASN